MLQGVVVVVVVVVLELMLGEEEGRMLSVPLGQEEGSGVGEKTVD